MKLSIVTTLYKSEFYIAEFYKRIVKEAKKITLDYEIIFVNDGSPDNSLERAVGLFKKDSHVKVIDLSRNFGHHKAIMTGLSHAKGEYIFLIDSDLEEDPELLTVFWEKLNQEEDLDVIYGVQERRKGNWLEKFSGSLFYKLFNKLSNVKIPKNIVTARLTTKRYNDALIQHKEQEIFLAGLWVITGFKQLAVMIKKSSHSDTTYSIGHRFAVLANFVTSFSNTPLKAVLYSGFIISLFSFLFIIYIISRKIFSNIALEGWSSLIVSVWFLGGLILFSIGTIGIYISKIFIETKDRPYTVIKKKYERDRHE